MARPIRSTSLDTAFTDLARDADGRVEVLLRDPASDQGVALWMDAKHSYVQVFTGDALPAHARESLAVEPMTAPRTPSTPARAWWCSRPPGPRATSTPAPGASTPADPARLADETPLTRRVWRAAARQRRRVSGPRGPAGRRRRTRGAANRSPMRRWVAASGCSWSGSGSSARSGSPYSSRPSR